jgi:hypothetical protein
MTDYIQRRILCVGGIIGTFTGLIITVVESSKLPTSIPNMNTPRAEASSYSAQDLMNYRASTTEYKVMTGGIVLAALSFVFTMLMIKLGIFEIDAELRGRRRSSKKKERRVIPYEYLVPPSNDIISQGPRQQQQQHHHKPQINVCVAATIRPAEVSYSPVLTSSKIQLIQNRYRSQQLSILAP